MKRSKLIDKIQNYIDSHVYYEYDIDSKYPDYYYNERNRKPYEFYLEGCEPEDEK